MTGIETKRARGKCIANALVCQLCWTFLFSLVVSLVHSSNGNFIGLLVGVPAYQRRLQAVLNAAARLVVLRLRRYDHVTDALAILHWLRLPEQVKFKLALMACRVLQGMAPEYLNQLVPVSDLASLRRLRSSSILQLLVPPYRLTTIGRRSFPVAASIVWNSLPVYLQSSPSLHVLATAKDTSLSTIIPWHPHLTSLHCASVHFVICHFSHVKKHWLNPDEGRSHEKISGE